MKRDTPKSRAWANRRKPIRARSDARIAEAPIRQDIVRRALQRDGYRCVAESLVPEVACGGQLDVHEVIPRSAWPGAHLVLDAVLTLCRSHHRWTGDNPTAAHALGLHGYSWERP